MQCVLDIQTHTYTTENNETIKYSVSDIVKIIYSQNYNNITPAILEKARINGLMYHYLIADYLRSAKAKKTFQLGEYTFLAKENIRLWCEKTYAYIKRNISNDQSNFNFANLHIEKSFCLENKTIAGTLDWLYITEKKAIIIDWKSNNPISETALIKDAYKLQLILYAYLIIHNFNNITDYILMNYNPRKKEQNAPLYLNKNAIMKIINYLFKQGDILQNGSK